MTLLQTDRLILRNLTEADAAVMFEYRNDPRCARYQRGQNKARNQIEALIKRRKNDVISADHGCMMGLALKDTGELVGEMVVMPAGNSFSLGYTVHYRHHRKGYASEALNALIDHLHEQFPQWEILCFVDPQNEASRGLLRKLRFEEVGYLPAMESVLFGKWVNPETREDVLHIQEQYEK